MKYRISKAQIQMLLDGKHLSLGNDRKLVLPKDTQVFDRLTEIMSDPVEADKRSFFTDGMTVFVEQRW